MVTERIVSQLLTELDGIQTLKGVIVMAATNRLDIVDPSIIRPGRIDKLLYIPLPDKKAREEILSIHTKDIPLSSEVKLEKIAELSDGFSGADIGAIINTAMSILIQEFISKYPKPENAIKHLKEIIIKDDHIHKAIKKVRTSRDGRPDSKVSVPYYR